MNYLTFRMHVADFLDLERTFEASGVLVPPTHQQQTLRVGQYSGCKLLESLILLKDLLDHTRHLM